MVDIAKIAGLKKKTDTKDRFLLYLLDLLGN